MQKVRNRGTRNINSNKGAAAVKVVGCGIAIPADLYGKLEIVAARLSKLEGREVDVGEAAVFLLSESVSTPRNRKGVARLNKMISR